MNCQAISTLKRLTKVALHVKDISLNKGELCVGFKSYLPLLKLRISCLITFSAIVGDVAGTTNGMSWGNMGFLIIVTMLASASGGTFNNYFDRDIDCLMGRTKKRPLTSPEFGSP